MKDKSKAEWLELGKKLQVLDDAKFDEVLAGLRDLVEAQQIIKRFDWQLMFRRRPSTRKRYLA